MLAPRSSRVSEVTLDSHRDFIKNHLLNSSMLPSLSFNAASRKERSAKTEREPVEVSADMLQDLFDEIGTITKAVQGDVQVYIRRVGSPLKGPKTKLGAKTRTVILRFTWPGEYLIVTAHCYIAEDGSLGAGGLVDPKCIQYAREAQLKVVKASPAV